MPLGSFSGLNNQDNSLIIPNSNAQDLLNVDITPGGRSVKKRHGYGVDATLGISTSAVHNGYHFFDASGNDIRLWMNDTNVSASVNSGAYTAIVTSATVNSTLTCADSQGLAWCVDSNQDQVFRTNGATVTFFPSHPKGTLITASPTRLAIGNVSGTANSIYFSASGDFTNETTGSQSSSAYIESILAPGSHLTHLRYWNGRYLWWKDQSFGYEIGDDQFSAQIIIVSNLVGTYDNASVENEGIIYFRGNDNHIWAYDGGNLVRLTREITPTTNNSNKRKTNSWTQTTQADFQGGTNVPTVNLSETISPGDVIVSSFQAIENSNTQWNSGTTNNTTVYTSSIVLTTNNSGNVTNPDFESVFTGNWTGAWTRVASITEQGCTQTPQSGSWFANQNITISGFSLTGKILDINNNTLSSVSVPDINDCTWRQYTIPSAGLVGTRIKVRFVAGSSFLTTSDSYILGGPITFYAATPNANATAADTNIDNVQNGSSTITSGSFTSQVYNTGFTSATYSLTNFAWTANTSTPTFNLQTSANSNGPWRSILTSSATNAVGDQYVQYTTTISINSTDNALSAITGATILARSTGTYYSTVNNAPNFTSWGILNVHDTYVGVSSITYYTRASNTTFTQTAASPAWVAQTKNATVAATPNQYFQLRADFSITAATETAALNDFTFNWNEGSAADQAYGTYFDFGIWWSVSYTTAATTNNRILRYDLINQTWTVYDIAANGFLVQNNNLYFGSPTTGKVYIFANGNESDNGTAINAYWQSKDFVTYGPNFFQGYNALDQPFNTKEYRTLSTMVAAQTAGTLNITYTLDRLTASTYSMNMFDAAGLLTIRHNYQLPSGTNGNSISLKYGNNAVNQPFELLGAQLTYMPKPWIVYSP